MERETEEIARRILEHTSSGGRQFRDIAVLLRVREPYASALETTFDRLSIPARFYFAGPAADHPAVQFLSGIVRALISGWDHEKLLGTLRTCAGDQFDFALRELLPGAGLPVPGLPEPPPILDRLLDLDFWRRERIDAQAWAGRIGTLASFLPQPVIQDGLRREQVSILRSRASAIRVFAEGIECAAIGLRGAGRMTLDRFWPHVETALSLAPLRVEDGRRNVVHVLDVYEARQWELPVVFVCGLTERHFPQYAQEDPLLGDAERRRLGMRTSQDQQAEERFLFEVAVTLATEEVALSYPRFDDKGAETLPSFFLDETPPPIEETILRPRPKRSVAPVAPEPVPGLKAIHRRLSPTSIETFLQCPFRFFGQKTLRLRERPLEPRDRLRPLLQGGILHRALAELAQTPLLGSAVFDQVFDEECAQARVPRTYRTEAVRLELLRCFEDFLEDRLMTLHWPSRVEEKFSFPLGPLLTIRGRIDRLETGPRQQALVIDYKHNPAAKIREKIKLSEAGSLVQGGLYLLAAEKHFGMEPIGMLYCGLKKGVTWDGWHVQIAGLENIGETCTAEALRELMRQAERSALDTYESIVSGRVAPEPADTKICAWCEYRDICRVETS